MSFVWAMCRVLPYIIPIFRSLSCRAIGCRGHAHHRQLTMKTVLLIDDDNIFLLTIGVRLKSMGYTVCTAKDAASAITVVRKTSPDVIVLDVSLPAGEGFLVAERLKNFISSAATPIIFVTASEKPGLRERAMKLGAVAFLAKPFDATTLADAIESALSPDASWQPQVNEA